MCLLIKVQGTVRVGENLMEGHWFKCGEQNYRQQKDNKKKCRFKLKSMWPGTVTRINVELLNPPKYSSEYANIGFTSSAPNVFDFTTSKKYKGNKKKEKIPTAVKNICWGDRQACRVKYGPPEKTAIHAGSGTNVFIGKLWTKKITLKVINKKNKRPLEPNMYYKINANFDSSTVWRKYLGFNTNPTFGKIKKRTFFLQAPKFTKLGLDIDFEPKNVIVGQVLTVWIVPKNKESGFYRSKFWKAKLQSAKSSTNIENEWQNVDIIVSPIGNGRSKNIGLQPIKNIVQIRYLTNPFKRAKSPAKFKVNSGGKQCLSFKIEGSGAPYYSEQKTKCVSVVGELKAEYKGYDPKGHRHEEIYNHEQSTKFRLVIVTGAAKLQGVCLSFYYVLFSFFVKYEHII